MLATMRSVSSRRASSTLLALALPAALLASCQRTPSSTVRLLDAPAEAEAEGPAPGLEPVGRGPQIGEVPWPRRLGEVAMAEESGREVRKALLAGAGTRYRFRVELPRDPALRVGLGYDPPADDASEAPAGRGAVRFRVRVTSEGDGAGGGETVLDERRRVDRSSGWTDREVDLSPWAGEAVVLELAVDMEPAGATVAAWASPEVVSRAGPEEGWNILLVSLDTLRADRLGCYGHERPTSPHLDALAARGFRFATAVAQAPWTRPSHHSFLTGLYPASHGDLRSPYLAEELWRAGYRTTAITGGGQIDARFGFDDGFEAYRTDRWVEDPRRAVRAFELNRGRRHFVFLHTYRIHDPYEGQAFAANLPRGRLGETFGKHDWQRLDKDLTAEEQAYAQALYDGGILETDRALGRLLDALEERGFLEDTLVVVTSDHGEQFWEHGSWRHGQNLYDEQILVPLIVYLPPRLARKLGVEPGKVVEEQVELVDLYPTLLDLVGVGRDHPVQGRSLVPLLTGGDYTPREAFAENTNVEPFERKGFRSPRFKFVKNIPRSAARKRGITEPFFELYDLRRDPEESHDLSERHPDVVRRLDQRIQTLRAELDDLDEAVPEGLDPDLREELEALGYLGD
ncbi:MAG: sulfatase [bacterium]